ncbi:MAG: glycoside hydrolase family 5 protein [Thermoguttaceae bacterium]
MKTIHDIRSRVSAAARLARLAALACACLALASTVLADETFVQRHGPLSVKGNKIVDKDGNPTTLHGMSLYCWAQQGWQYFNTSAINHFAQDWKCTVIRIAILPRAYKNNPTKEIDKVKTVMDACIANGIYGIIDWHSMRGAQNDVKSSQAFFSTLATAYGKTPNIMYEPWNEPEQEPWPVIKAYHEAVISTIRPIDPDSIIICGNRHWDQECAEASKDPITSSKNIAYSIHFYAATHRQSLRGNGATALKNGVALFSTEYGTSSASGGGAYDPAETKKWWTWLDENDVGCANWSATALGETSAAFKPGASTTGPWTDDMLKPSGLLVRNYIISKAK